MDADEVRRLAAAGETFTVEFKGDRHQPFGDNALVEAAVCLANGDGGLLLIGVEDDGAITGARPRHGEVTDPFRVQALIANRTVPQLQTTVHVVRVDEREVVVAQVPAAPRVVGTNKGLYVRRAQLVDGRPACVPFPAHEMLAREIDRGAVDYASLPISGATWEDLDPLEFERLRRLVRSVGPGADSVLSTLSDEDIGRALGVAVTAQGIPSPLTGAILLFGREDSLRRLIPTHETAFQVLDRSRVVVNDFARRPLLFAAEDLFTRVQAYNAEDEVDAGLIRVSIPRIPAEVIREVVANALVHREYTMLGAVHVRLDDDTLEVSSPGGFPPGVRLENLLNAQRPRSPLLADAFKRSGLVERTGRGINRMFEAMLRTGRDAPDYSRSTSESVSAGFTLTDPDRPLLRFVLDREARDGQPMRLAELQILHELRREGHLTTSEVADLLQVTDPQARMSLTRMIEAGMVEARGERRGRSYHLTSAVYRWLDSASAYPRVRGFDRLQQEQMIITYVAAHGRITRHEVTDLCAVSSTQAAALLRDLARAGRLELHGQRRWSYYVIPRGQQPSS